VVLLPVFEESILRSNRKKIGARNGIWTRKICFLINSIFF